MAKISKYYVSVCASLIVLFIFSSQVFAVDLILSAPPRESKQAGEKLYVPIAKKLSEIVGQHVVYQHPKNWAEYATNMRNGRYDIVFDGPHFVAWRQKNLKHEPIVSLPGSLQFVVVTHKSNKQMTKTRDLVGQKICGFPSPHLATDLVFDLFNNPVLQPNIVEVKGGQDKSYQAFRDGKCVATIMRTVFFKHLPENEKQNLKVVATTKELPNQSISISQRLHNNADKLTNFLTSKQGAMIADGLLTRYSRNKKAFVKANPKKFAGAVDILEGVVWGW